MADASVQPARATRWRRTRLLILLGILVALVGYTGCDLWAGRRLDAEIARLEPKYGNLRNRTLIAPSVPAANNRARLVRAAAALVNTSPTVLITRLASVGPASDTDLMPPDLRAFVEENREAIVFADKIPSRTQASWDVDFTYGGSGDSLPYLDVRNLAFILSLNAMLELEAKRPDEAVRTVTVGLAISSSLNNEPQLIAQLIRMSIADRHFMVVQRVILQTEPTKSALEDLARWLKENRPDPARIGLEAELAYVSNTLAQTEVGRTQGLFDRQLPGASLFLRIGRPLVRMAHARQLEELDALLAIEAGPRPRPEFRTSNPPPWAFIDRFISGTIDGLARIIITSDDYLSTLGAAEVAVALRRYRIDHGSYPDDLSALTPTYLDRLPINPFTGQVPAYSREGTGFTLRAPRAGIYAQTKRPLPDWQVSR